MPIKEPLETILDPNMSRVLARETIQIASPLLRELVNDATHVFARCVGSSIRKEGEDIPVLFSYLHIIEMTDAIEVLVSQACAVPIIPCLRSSFEALLSMKYILQEDYTRRSSAYTVTHAHRRIHDYELLDPDTQRGHEFLESLQKDEARQYMVSETPNALQKRAKEAIQNLRHLISKDANNETELEYQQLKKKSHKRLEWYRLFNGPSSLRELASRLNYRARYDLLYRWWSNIAHASDLSRFITKTKGGKGAIRPLRSVDELAQLAGFAAWIMLEAKTMVLEKFRPEEGSRIAEWYVREIQKRFLGLYGH